MATIQTQIRIDAEVKPAVSELFRELGLDMSTAINIFLRKCLLAGGLPFEVRDERLSRRTEEAIEEAERLMHDPDAKTYEVHDLIRELHGNT